MSLVVRVCLLRRVSQRMGRVFDKSIFVKLDISEKHLLEKALSRGSACVSTD
jgi:hypothetical protein